MGNTEHRAEFLRLMECTDKVETSFLAGDPRKPIARPHFEVLRRILRSECPSAFLRMLLATGNLQRVMPELLPLVGLGQNKYHEYDVWEHTLHVVDAVPSYPTLRLAALLHDIGKPRSAGVNLITGEPTFHGHETVGAEMAHELLWRKLSKHELFRVTNLVRHHMIPTLPNDQAIRRWVRRVGSQNVDDVFTLARADSIGKGNPVCRGRSALARLRAVRVAVNRVMLGQPPAPQGPPLAINGHDVMAALGIPPGQRVGVKLKEMAAIVAENPELNTRECLLRLLNPVL